MNILSVLSNLPRKTGIFFKLKYPGFFLLIAMSFTTTAIAENHTSADTAAEQLSAIDIFNNSQLVADINLKKYILFTYSHLAKDIIIGQGEYLDSLYKLLDNRQPINSKIYLDNLRSILIKKMGPLQFSDAVVRFRNTKTYQHQPH